MKNHKDDELLPPTPEQTEWLRVSQDPYAKLSVTLREPEPKGAAAPPLGNTTLPRKQGVTQREFETVFRRVVGFYVPDSDRLPTTYRDFLERNKRRSPSARQRLIEKLRKYDLSEVLNQAHFNREERNPLTEARLKEIEDSVSDE